MAGCEVVGVTAVVAVPVVERVAAVVVVAGASDSVPPPHAEVTSSAAKTTMHFLTFSVCHHFANGREVRYEPLRVDTRGRQAVAVLRVFCRPTPPTPKGGVGRQRTPRCRSLQPVSDRVAVSLRRRTRLVKRAPVNPKGSTFFRFRRSFQSRSPHGVLPANRPVLRRSTTTIR